MSEKRPRSPKAVRRAQVLVCLIAIGALVIFLLAHGGTGNLSAPGIGEFSLLCPLGGVETLLASKLFIPRAVVALVVTAVIVVLVGKVFCGWICPTPHLMRLFKKRSQLDEPESSGEAHDGNDTDMITVAPDGSGGSNAAGEVSSASPMALSVGSCSSCATGKCSGCTPLPPVGGKRDGLQVDSRHVVLGGSLLATLAFGFPVFCLVCPIGLTFATLMALWQLFVGHEPTWALVVFPLIVVAELLLFRKWCHRICPVGALLSLLSQKAPLFKPRVNVKRCLRSDGNPCTVCVDVCPEGLDPHGKSLGECTKCGLCVSACPAGAISLPVIPSKSQPAPQVLCENSDKEA